MRRGIHFARLPASLTPPQGHNRPPPDVCPLLAVGAGDINSFLKEAAMMQRLANAPQASGPVAAAGRCAFLRSCAPSYRIPQAWRRYELEGAMCHD